MGEQVAARSIKKELVLPVIRESKRFGFLMTDKVQSNMYLENRIQEINR